MSPVSQSAGPSDDGPRASLITIAALRRASEDLFSAIASSIYSGNSNNNNNNNNNNSNDSKNNNSNDSNGHAAEENQSPALAEQGSSGSPARNKLARGSTGKLSRNSTFGNKEKDHRDSATSDIPHINIRTSTAVDVNTPPGPFTRKNSDLRRGFLGRLALRSHRDAYEPDDGASHMSEYGVGLEQLGRTMAAPDAAGFIPTHKEPPRYLKIKSTTKDVDFDNLFLAQELCRSKPMPSTAPLTTAGKRVVHSDDSVWAVEFSKDGRYLATAGQDHVVRLYAVLSTPDERRAYEHEAQHEEPPAEGSKLLNAPVFRSRPVREYRGHAGSVHDLSWSKNNFLLSASADKTVRLWHPNVAGCIHAFGHRESVMAIGFHPTDDRFFLAGARDGILRLWCITDKEVAFEIPEPEIITAVGFSPDGKTCMAGLVNGECVFYETDGLRRQARVHVRSSRGKNSKGSKITSIQAMAIPPAMPGAPVKVLVSTNDSRIRMYDLRTKALDLKLKGHENSCSNVKARFSDDGAYVISGSEDRRAFVWSADTRNLDSRNKRPCESFVAHRGAVTAAVMAPRETRVLLSASGDPVFDLCNPPPVTLMSMAESMASVSRSEEDKHQHQHQHADKRLTESPAYLSRSAHPDGNIIVTSDRTGQIRVFRQDCANQKRRHELWETGSTRFANGTHGRASFVSSSRTPSRRSSFVGANPPPGLSPQHSSDMIISWRQNVEGQPGGGGGGGGGGAGAGGHSRPSSLISVQPKSERSSSPSTTTTAAAAAAAATAGSPGGAGVAASASEARRQPYAVHAPSPLLGSVGLVSPASAVAAAAALSASLMPGRTNSGDSGSCSTTASHPPTPSFSYRFVDSVNEDAAGGAGASVAGGGDEVVETAPSIWNLAKWRGHSGLRISATAPSSPKLELESPKGNVVVVSSPIARTASG